MMTTALALIAATLAATSAPVPATGADAFGPLTAGVKLGSDLYCIRSGWTTAANETGRVVRRGDCRTAANWRARGLTFESPASDFAKLRRAAKAERVASR